MNLGQLLQLVRARYLVDAVGYNRVTGKPFKAGEIAERGGAAVSLDFKRSNRQGRARCTSRAAADVVTTLRANERVQASWPVARRARLQRASSS